MEIEKGGEDREKGGRERWEGERKEGRWRERGEERVTSDPLRVQTRFLEVFINVQKL